jgi:hypothetical protein
MKSQSVIPQVISLAVSLCYLAVDHYHNGDRIPTYSASGRRIRDYSLSEITRLLGGKAVTVRRNRNGEIVSAQFNELSGKSPLRATAHMGTSFAYREHIGDFRVWKHDLHCGKLEHEDNDLYARRIFRAVPLSVMAQ